MLVETYMCAAEGFGSVDSSGSVMVSQFLVDREGDLLFSLLVTSVY